MIIMDSKDNQELFLNNYFYFMGAKLEFQLDEHTAIWEYISEFSRAHGHIPEVITVSSHFNKTKKFEIVDQIELLKSVSPMVRGDFEVLVKEKVRERRIRKVIELLSTSGEICSQGLKVKTEGREEKILIGPEDAVRYVIDQAHDIITPVGSIKLYGEATSDTETFTESYDRMEKDPRLGIGQLTGIMQLDEAMGGARKTELWAHAAWTGHLKSTFSLNWLYTQAVYYGSDSTYFSLEMSYEQCLRNFYIMHSFHEKFTDIRMHLGLQTDANTPVGLEYSKLKYAKFSPEEKEFFFEYVLPDLKNPENNYGKVNIEIFDPDKMDFTVLDVQSRSELIYSKKPFTTLFIDHASLMSPRKRYQNRTDQLNEVVRDLKRLSMNFYRGSGMAVVILFQMSRMGYLSALKNGGLYNLTNLSYCNELEKSADVVTSSWCEGEMKKEGKVLFQNLKMRDGAGFDPCYVRIEWPCKRMLTCLDLPVIKKEDSKEKHREARVPDNLID
jgi:replicative DNA helicase